MLSINELDQLYALLYNYCNQVISSNKEVKTASQELVSICKIMESIEKELEALGHKYSFINQDFSPQF